MCVLWKLDAVRGELDARCCTRLRRRTLLDGIDSVRSKAAYCVHPMLEALCAGMLSGAVSDLDMWWEVVSKEYGNNGIRVKHL